MSAQNPVNLAALLEECGLMERAVKVEDSVYHLQWGSAEVVVGVTDHAVAVFAPLFKELPAGKEGLFCLRLLQLNDVMGGVASFAIQPDGWVVLHAGRSVKGMDTGEFRTLVTAVCQFADLYDDQLYLEFFAPPAAAQGTPAGDDDPVAPADAVMEAGPSEA
jgi:hypothetical protein